MDKRKYNGKSIASRKCQEDRKKLGLIDAFDVETLYHKEGKTLKEIGRIYGVSAATVLKFCRDHNIPRRSKSEIMVERMSCPETRAYLSDKSTEAYIASRKFATGPERHFEEWLKSKDIDYVTQYRRIGNKHPYDFFLKDHNLLVEIDGHYWHSKSTQKIKDDRHTADALKKGYFIVRIDTLSLKEYSYEALLGDYIEF